MSACRTAVQLWLAMCCGSISCCLSAIISIIVKCQIANGHKLCQQQPSLLTFKYITLHDDISTNQQLRSDITYRILMLCGKLLYSKRLSGSVPKRTASGLSAGNSGSSGSWQFSGGIPAKIPESS